jgi:hypothetical protein
MGPASSIFTASFAAEHSSEHMAAASLEPAVLHASAELALQYALVYRK